MRDPEVLLDAASRVVAAATKRGADHAEAYVSEGESLALEYQGDHGGPHLSHTLGIGLRILRQGRQASATISGLDRLDALLDDAFDASRSFPATLPDFAGAAPAHKPYAVPDAIWSPDPDHLEERLAAVRQELATPDTTYQSTSLKTKRSHYALATSNGLETYDRHGFESATLQIRLTQAGNHRTGLELDSHLQPYGHDELTSWAAAMRDRAADAFTAKPLDKPVQQVILGPHVVKSLVARSMTALAGDALVEDRSPLGPESEPLAEALTITDVPLRSLDGEGVPTAKQPLLENGRVSGRLWDRRTSHLHGATSTGNGQRRGRVGVAVSPHHVQVKPGRHDVQDLVAQVDGEAVLLLSPLSGMFAANQVTGDFSVISPHATLIRDGEVQRAIPHTTVGGNAFAALRSVTAVGSDVWPTTSGSYPSLLCGGMTCSN